MELRVAAEACIESGIEKRTLSAGLSIQFVAIEESLHPLAVAELDDGEPRLLFEETA